MKKTGLIYSFNTKHTSVAAEKIAKAMGKASIEKVNVETIIDEMFLSFDHMIVGVSTWWEGELPNYWDEFRPAIEDMNLAGKKIAIFGHGDQVNYPLNFADAVGILARLFEKRGAEIIGHTSLKGYVFERSEARSGDYFTGLVLDDDNQQNLTDKRITDWVKIIKEEFGN